MSNPMDDIRPDYIDQCPRCAAAFDDNASPSQWFKCPTCEHTLCVMEKSSKKFATKKEQPADEE